MLPATVGSSPQGLLRVPPCFNFYLLVNDCGPFCNESAETALNVVDVVKHFRWIRPKRFGPVRGFRNAVSTIFTAESAATKSRRGIDTDLTGATRALTSNILTSKLPSPLIHRPHTRAP